jgi:hypothetical protein
MARYKTGIAALGEATGPRAPPSIHPKWKLCPYVVFDDVAVRLSSSRLSLVGSATDNHVANPLEVGRFGFFLAGLGV